MHSLYAKNAALTEASGQVKVCQEILGFISQSRHMKELLQKNMGFRRVVYDKCAEFMSHPECTRRLAFASKSMRLRIEIMGGV